VDLNGDGTPDVAYAGDNQGHLWKFDLTSENPSNWKVAFGGVPLYSATGPASLGSASRTRYQPITAAPTVTANDRMKTVGSGPSAQNVAVGGMMVAFGTGRNVEKYDPTNRDVQSLYSVLDNTRYRTISTPLGKRVQVHPGAGSCPLGPDCVPAPTALGSGVATAKLAQQKITEIGTGAFATVDVVDDLKQSSWDNYNGWYLDLPAVGERLLKPMEFYDGSNILSVFSQVPAKGSDVDPKIESCDSSAVDNERQYRTLINIMDGKRPTVQIVDMNGDGFFNAISDQGVSRAAVSKGSHNLITKGNRIIDIDTKNKQEILARMPEQTLRPSWRQVK
jgi:type IV pilus assembly protein PilY1